MYPDFFLFLFLIGSQGDPLGGGGVGLDIFILTAAVDGGQAGIGSVYLSRFSSHSML